MSAGFLAFLAAIAVASLAGGLLPLTTEWPNRSLLMPVSFSGGVLLGAAFFEMIPESADMLHGGIGVSLLVGFLIIFVLEHFALVHPHPEAAAAHGQAHHIHLGATAYAGLSFHALLDGLALSSTYSRPEVGSVVLLAIISHKIPTAFALTSLLLLDRWSRSAILGWMTVFAFSTPVGAIVTWIILRHADNVLLGNAIALSAGTFLAVATSDVLPQIRRFNGGQNMAQRAWPLVALLAGLSVTWLARTIAG